MQRKYTTARFGAAALTLVTAIMATQLPAAAQGQGDQVTICHRTGSPSNPWVFMIIDSRTWPEHQAEGDIQATSLADCPQPTVAPAVAATVAPSPSPTPQPAPPPVAVRQQSIAPGKAAIPAAPGAELLGAATPAPSTATPATPATPTNPATPAPTVEVAGVRAEPATDAPDISTLPKSGGEPDRGLLVIGLLAVAAMGMAMRRVARRRL
jgi:hypothetical protein